ncbi:hypothetical protein V1505DRAFT_416284 [Lipomyces doorenjongii]
MENKATEQGGAAALAVEMTTAESSADPGTAQSKASADNSVPGPSATVPAHNLSKSTHMKTKKPAPMATRNTAAVTQRASSASSRPHDRIASLTRSTAASAALTTSARESTTTFNPPSRLLAPTEASKAHAYAPRNAETRAPVRSRSRASAPSAVGNPTRPVQRASTKSTGVRPFAGPTASSLRLSSNAGSKPLTHSSREEKAVRTLRNESVHNKPAGTSSLTAEREAKASKPHHRSTAEELVIAAAGSVQKVAAVEDKINDDDIIERDKKMPELSAELEASKKKLHDSVSHRSYLALDFHDPAASG